MSPITKKIELLAPGGDIDSIKAAIAAGADAVYCGLNRFNARNRAENIAIEELSGMVRLAHKHNCAVFITLNIIIVENEIPALLTLLNRLVNSNIDGVIVQDLGLLYLLGRYYKTLPIHASTQLTTHNQGQIAFLSRLGATRVNLSRELSLPEIADLTVVAHKNNLLTEVFVHGSNCLSFSGLCYFSSVHGGNSGNRGRCSQPCRNQYRTTAASKEFPLNLKDNSAFSDLAELVGLGVDSIKIEGRIKQFHYVYTVVKAFRKQLQRLYRQHVLKAEDSELRKVFNRGFTDSFLRGDISRDMFIDSPRDYSAVYRSQLYGGTDNGNLERAKRELYDEKTVIINEVKEKIAKLRIEKVPVQIHVSGKVATPLTLSVATPDKSFSVHSKADLAPMYANSDGAECIGAEMLRQRLKGIDDKEYFIAELTTDGLQENLYLSFKELAALKKEIVFILNGRKKKIAPLTLPPLSACKEPQNSPSLSILIASKDDLYLSRETDAELFFQVPDSLSANYNELVKLFKGNKWLVPWFSPLSIGADYHAVVALLQELKPEKIVVNNTGVAWAADQQEIPWIAGPYLNSVNSYTFVCLKERFTCSGAFVSNELARKQIKPIKKPDAFKLYYSLYHSVPLMTSRQCLLQQVTGCEKNSVDRHCLQQCEKSSTITNLKNETFYLTKTAGNFHRLYDEYNFLNTEIVTDIKNLFAGFFIDISTVQTGTGRHVSKPKLIRLFEDLLAGKQHAAQEIQQSVYPTNSRPYQKGI